MTLYIDVLIFINSIIDYLLLNLASLVVCRKIKTLRLVLSSCFAALYSLIIFIPKIHTALLMIFSLIWALLTVILAYGFKNIKVLLKFYISFLTISISFNGIITVIWFFLKPQGMIFKNSILYFNISAIEMIIWTVVSYVIIKSVLFVIRRNSPLAQRCKITFINYDKVIEVIALVDTGNSLKDVYGGKQVIIVDKKTADEIFGDVSLLSPILLPYSTVNGNNVIPAYKCKNTKINNNFIGCTLIAVTDKNIDSSDYKAIVSPEILNEGDFYAKNN
jgi:stage II sporulation protein GA (sporulation sigma-E factor processing peptidase)